MHMTHKLFWLWGLIYLRDYLPIWILVYPYEFEKKMREVEKRSVTNECAMAEVTKHPRVMLKIQKELDSVVGLNIMVLESNLSQLNYLHRTVSYTHESTRAPKLMDMIFPQRHFRPDRHIPTDGSRVEINHGVDFKIFPFSARKRNIEEW
ncbi:hypothetical protein DCAR_0206049 [Daucus carota subsp. sativus]|uniref:Uncharacterized protein n=1 Tax=Daucus carota subsp. sativus TaxID=79200 RepID=A0AAF0WF07_DAUCS|nr:hypothetical protein DCAR_0206049 [Daucus carota subsp. sativus]